MTTSKRAALTYTNRLGETYYLHQGTTKAGRPRYFFAKTVREGALAAMPDGFEASESINGVVSVRRVGSRDERIPSADLRLVEVELQRHPHLGGHRAAIDGDAIVIYEPFPRPVDLPRLEQPRAHARYAPVMKFVLGRDGYAVHRMTYRGRGGWSYPLKHGALASL
ncbi:MAG: hypothetical protein AB7S26_27065, partial [Sandaracinaceae bacterium]